MEICRNDHTVYIKPKGEIAFTTVDGIKDRIYGFLKPEDQVMILNLSDVEFVDSCGLGLLISMLKRMKSQGGRLIVEYPQLGVQKLMEMTRLDQVIEVRKTPEKTTGSWSKFV